MSIAKSIASSVSRSAASSVASAALTPVSFTNLRQYALDGGNAYETSNTGGFSVLRSLEPYGTHRQPRKGRAWLFDGTDDYGAAADSASLRLTTDFTITAWLKRGADANGGIVFKGTAALWNYTFFYNSGNLDFYSDILGNFRDTLTTLSAGWTHVAVTRNGTTAKFFVDGVEIKSGTYSGAFATSADEMWVGRDRIDNVFKTAGYLRDVRIFNVGKTQLQIAAIMVGDIDLTGLSAHYPCNEESGTTGYDISGNGNHLTLNNITQSTFHATDTEIAINRNNSEGYRLSGSVYIPKRLSDANAADGNALTVTGQSPYPINVEVPCITGNGSTVFANLGTSPIQSGNTSFTIEGRVRFTNSASGLEVVTWNGTDAIDRCHITYRNGSGKFVSEFGSGTAASTSTTTLLAGVWYKFKCEYNGSSNRVWIDDVLEATVNYSAFNHLPLYSYIMAYSQSGGALHITGSIADYLITTGGVTTYFPLQDGPGSSNTNRDLSYIKSDGTYGVVAGAITNGTVADIWANRCPVAQDWCVNYGGDIAANGAFLPGQISGSLASDGTAKTLTAGKFGNPYSRINFNPFIAAELNGLGVQTSYEDLPCGTFDGSNDYAIGADNDAFDFGVGSWTYVTTIKPVITGGYETIFSKNTTYATTNGIRIFRAAGDNLVVYWGSDAQYYNHATSGISPAGQWSTLAIGVNASNSTVFSRTNGVSPAPSSTTVQNVTNTSQIVLGAANVSQYFYTGSMAYSAMYNVALTNSQIDEVHAGKIVPTGLTIANLVAFWSLTERDSNMIYDYSNNGNNLTITNATTAEGTGFWANKTDGSKVSATKFSQRAILTRDTKWNRVSTDGDDRFFTTAAALTGATKTNAEDYVS